MKKTVLLLSLAVIWTIIAISAFAGSAVVVRGKVPFDFFVENQLLPAGEYHFEMGATGGATTSTVTICTKEGSVVAFATTRPGNRLTNASQLTFNHYSGKYFLSGVESVGHKASLRTTSHERELMSLLGSTQVALILPRR